MISTLSAPGRRLAITGALALSVALGGCSGTEEIFGLAKSAPDEFAVVARVPLAMPPDYGLRPPAPGVRRPQEREIKDQARRTLVSSGTDRTLPALAGKGRQSAGESALLARAGARNADPSIRKTVNRENQVLAENEGGLVDKMMFWRESPPPGSVLNAGLEAKRLRENSALGDAATKGATPVIEHKRRGLLDRFF